MAAAAAAAAAGNLLSTAYRMLTNNSLRCTSTRSELAADGTLV